MKYVFPKIQKTTIPPEKFPETINLESIVKKFKEPHYTLGSWPKKPEPTPELVNDDVTHIVREVDLMDGNLEITFEFANTLRGMELAHEYENNIKMIPVLDKRGTSVIRFDFIQEE